MNLNHAFRQLLLSGSEKRPEREHIYDGEWGVLDLLFHNGTISVLRKSISKSTRLMSISFSMLFQAKYNVS